MKFPSMREPQVVRTPSVQNRSLCAIGTPASGPPRPAASSRSAAAACASAGSRSTEMNAFSACWLASMRCKSAPVSSTLENLRARNPAASAVRPSLWNSLTAGLLDHFGHQVEPRLHLRCILLVELMVVRLSHLIGPQALRQAGERMSHGGHTGRLARLQRAHEVDDPRQGVLVVRNLGSAEFETCQGGDACDLLACEAHGRCARCVAN